MLLELRDATKRYGDMVVIPKLSLSVEEGDFIGVIGPNGAGKSTMFGLISGSTRCDGGSVFLDGMDVTALDAAQRCRAGVGRTFQIPQPFEGMTAYENALVAATFGRSGNGSAAQALAVDAIERCGLAPVADKLAGTLTLLQRKRLELARAIATQPRLLLLDEVAGGLTDGEMQQLLQLIVTIHQSGVTILWIEHLVHALVSAADRLVVLASGAVICDGDPGSVMGDQTVRDTYLGSDIGEEVGHAAH
ncbi:branched-chain amino acid transport system ATP-binding protein [Variovorax boronicumulans]|uniref:ABC transporter ATP-binding protein n=1 Tax=Variovorax boronicumulans TaxID=436515 RepID=UPI002785F67B|nr:ABC transporter ATP-binding protein [Variovorax boronicumulans]MDQ0083147.1 branched-chain amino acid transport system ATP-binding protein [Variovorax boronicumulans]